MPSPAEIAKAMVAELNAGLDEMNRLMARAREINAGADRDDSNEELRNCLELIVRAGELTETEFNKHLAESGFDGPQNELLKSKLGDFKAKYEIARERVNEIVSALPASDSEPAENESMSMEQIDELLGGLD